VNLRSALIRALPAFLVAIGSTFVSADKAEAQALLLVDAGSGRVLHAESAGQPWYPASVTKMMTTYVALSAVRAGRIRLDSLIGVSERALAQQPSKMGFPVGTQMTLDNALKMLMVRSANDVAVTVAEGVAGTVEAFAQEMNHASARLGMTQSRWVNPHGLPDPGQVSSARDMAILARALLREFPQHSIYWRAPAIRFGRRVMRNYNRLIERYPGADGMKTGFICASGFNLVATATRGGRQLIAVVLGSPSGTERAETAARLLERGFSGGALAWLMPSLGTLETVQPVAADPPNLREQICGGKNRGKARTDHASEEDQTPGAANGGFSAFASILPGTGAPPSEPLLGAPVETMPPVQVSVIAPKGAPQDPDALLSRKRKPRAAKGKGKGRKSAVINVRKPGAKKSATPAGKKAAPAKPPARPAKPAAKPRSAGASKKK
jgi:D-alanyl-D-alanine carboxypeptidase